MGYYKEIKNVYLTGENYSANGTKSEMKKRNVDKDAAIRIENKVNEIKMESYFETSGEVEYGMGVSLLCTFDSGHTVRTTVRGTDYLSWVMKYTSVRGSIVGDFLFLFQGTVTRLVENGSKAHENFKESYEKQEEEKEKTKMIEVQVGDIVNIYGGSVYLGEFYYLKPNLKNTTLVNKLRKYKLYIEVDKEGNHEGGKLYVESGKTKYNQPTKITGHIDIDVRELKDKAQTHMVSMYDYGVGYDKVNSYYGDGLRARVKENHKSFVLANCSLTKEDVNYVSEDDILNCGWLCGFDYDKDRMERVKVHGSDRKEYYKYKYRTI